MMNKFSEINCNMADVNSAGCKIVTRLVFQKTGLYLITLFVCMLFIFSFPLIA